MKKTALSPMAAIGGDNGRPFLRKVLAFRQFCRMILPGAVAVICLAYVGHILVAGHSALVEAAFDVFFVASCGSLYQAVATFFDRRRYLPPGKLVDIDGSRLHMHVVGTGSPTVVFEAGLGAMSAGWGWIQPEIGKLTRTVSYDRAGLGWSDASPSHPSALLTSLRLHKLLQATGIPGPYVLVGHSMGGLLVRVFANLYSDEVAGMVLVDASHPDQHLRYPAIRHHMRSGFRMLKRIPFLARIGYVRLLRMFGSMAEGLPGRQRSEAEAFLSSLRHLRATLRESLAWNELCAEVRGSRGPVNKPFAVVSAGKDLLPGAAELQVELAALAPYGTHRIVEDATHVSLVTHREHAMAVVEAIRSVVDQVRKSSASDPDFCHRNVKRDRYRGDAATP